MEGYHGTWAFANGYGASVISTKASYGGREGLFELAVRHGDRLCYATPITDDVLGWLDLPEVNIYLERIRKLPVNERCSHRRPKEDEG